MQIFESIQEWQSFRKTLPTDKLLGFAPTMGNLHPGHLSLFETSRKENDLTATSLFINPTQFNRADDFKQYPRTLDADLALLESAGVDYCLLPSKEAMYPDDFQYQIHEQLVSLTLEGQHRPGHFTGVLTVVMKLFNLIKPHNAYFGEKDFQQYALIKGMVEAFFMDIQIRMCPTIRETGGLAFSSRNNRLNLQEKQQAILFARIFHQNKSCETLKIELKEAGIEIDYLEKLEGRIYVAVWIGEIRLIDNKPE